MARHIISVPFEARRGISAGTCAFYDVIYPDDLGYGPSTQIIIIYILCIIDTF